MKIKLQRTIVLIMVFSSMVFAQNNDLRIFGYFQNIALHSDVSFGGGENTYEANSFLMQQMNVMLAKNFNTEFSSFINFEYTNSFSFQDNVGGFKIEEAWLKYSPSRIIAVKFGYLIPQFNNMNEIKNKSVLLPYIFRPIAYETVYFDQYGTAEFVPVSANLQLYGEFELTDDALLNYALYVGNSETLYDNTSQYSAGQDQTSNKLVGGRLGFEYEDLALGVSFTSDRKDTAGINLGFVPRKRLGAYLNYSLFDFDLEAEYIGVTYDLTPENKDSLALNPFGAQNFDKKFYHVNLLYNISEKLGAYVGYNYIQGDDNFFIASGIDLLSFGAVYRVTNAILLKAQYTRQSFSFEIPGFEEGLRNDIAIGASVNF